MTDHEDTNPWDDLGRRHERPREERPCRCWVKSVPGANKALARQPDLYDALIEACERLIEGGLIKFSLELPWADVRLTTALRTGGEESRYKLNNDYKAPIQRMIVGDESVEHRIREALGATLKATDEGCPRHRDGWDWDQEFLPG
jgi:hypothetical protein